MHLTPRDLRRQQELEATRAVRRRAAVAAATDLFAQQGFHATAMADVAKAAGMSLKALYDAFASKEALFEAVLIDAGERFSVLLEAPAPAEDPVAWLLTFVDRLVELLAANSSALCLYSRGADGIPASLRSKGVNPFTGFMVRLSEMLATVIRHAQDQGAANKNVRTRGACARDAESGDHRNPASTRSWPISARWCRGPDVHPGSRPFQASLKAGAAAALDGRGLGRLDQSRDLLATPRHSCPLGGLPCDKTVAKELGEHLRK